MINRKQQKYDFMDLLSIDDNDILRNLIKSEENGRPLIEKYLDNMDLQQLFNYLYSKEDFNFKRRMSRIKNSYSDDGHNMEKLIFTCLSNFGITNKTFKLLSFFSLNFVDKVISSYENTYNDLNNAYQEVKRVLNEEETYLDKNNHLNKNEIKANEFLIIFKLFRDKEINAVDELSSAITSNDKDFLYSLLNYTKSISDKDHSLFNTIIKKLSMNNRIINFDGDAINATLIDDALSNNDRTEDAIFLLKNKDVMKLISTNNMKAYCKKEDHEVKDVIKSLDDKHINHLSSIIGIDMDKMIDGIDDRLNENEKKRKIFCDCSNSGCPNFVAFYMLCNEVLK